MSDNHGINLNINAAGARQGANEYVAAINAISSATVKYKAAMDSVNRGSSRANFSQMARDLNALSQIRVSGASTRAINDLSNAMRNFRGPNASAVKSTRDFLRVLAQGQVNGALARQIAAISTSFTGFRAPSRASAGAVQALMTALGAARLNPQTAGHLANIAGSLANFRGPTAASVRNIDGMVNALNNLRNPPDLSRLVTALNAISAASTNAARNMGNLSRMHIGNANGARTSAAETIKLTSNMRGLENAFSLTYQAGSLLRTLFGALTFSEFTRGIYDATIATQKFTSAMGVTNPTAEGVAKELAYTSQLADHFGVSLQGVREEYGRFKTASELAGQSVANTKYVFEAFSATMRVLGNDTQSQSRVYRALTQIFSKGQVTAEDFTQQLAEQIPAAVQIMQQTLSEAAGKKVDLKKMLQLGQVDDDAIVLMAKKLMEIFGPQLSGAMSRLDAQFERVGNAWLRFKTMIGEGGVGDALADVAKKVADVMNSDAFKGNSTAIIKALSDAIHAIGDAAVWAMTHTHEVASAITGLIAMGAAGKFVEIASSVMSMASSFGIAGLALGAIPVAIGAGAAALAYFWNDTVTVGDKTATVGAIATEVWKDIKTTALQAWEAIKKFSFTELINQFDNFNMASFTSWETLDTNATTAAKNTTTVWDKAFKLIVLYAADMYSKVGSSFEKIWTYGKEYAKATAEAWNPFESRSSTQIWDQMVIDTKAAFDKIDQQAKDFHTNVASQLGLTSEDLDQGLTGLVKGELDKYVARAKAQTDAANEAASKLAAHNTTKTPNNTPDNHNPDFNGLSPFKDPNANMLDSVAKRAKDAAKALASYKAEVAALQSQLTAGKISLDQYNQGLEYQARKYQEIADPYAAMVRTMKDDINLQGMATKAREVEVALREKQNQLMEKGITLTSSQTDELRKLIQTQQTMTDKPLQQWIDGIDTLGVATDKVAVTSIQGLNDQIASLVVTGKADFASLAQSILQDFIKVGLEQTEKQLFAPFCGGTQTAPNQTQVSNPANNLGQVIGNNTDLRPSLAATAPALDALKVSADAAAQALGRLGGLNPTTLPGTQSTNVSGATTVSNDFSTMAAANQWKANNPVPNDFATMAAANMAAKTTTAATAYNASSKTLTLSPQEIIDLKKTLSTEVDGRLTGTAYDQQAAGVTDTILNRKVAGNWGPTVTDVVNSKSQFSDINGGVAWKDNRNAVSQLPDSMLDSGNGLRSSQFVDAYLNKRMNGAPSSVDGNLNYANPNFADASAQKWISQLDGPTFGQGNMIHKHGTADGLSPVDPSYKIAMAGQTNTQPVVTPSGAIPPGYTYPQTPGLNWDGRMQKDVNGLVLHHTGMDAQPSDVVNVLNQRKLGAQYVMDRNGQITQLAPDMARVSQTKPAENGSGLNNSNSIGMEVMAKNDADVTEQQKIAAQSWIANMKNKYPNIGDNVYGHGELNSDKQPTEGKSIVDMWRQNQAAGIDPTMKTMVDPTKTNSIAATNTSSIKDASAALNQAMPSFDKLKTSVTDAGTAAQTASTKTQTANTTTTASTQQKVAADTQAGVAVQTAGQQSLTAGQNFTTAGQQINTAGQTAQQATPQVQGMSSGLSSLLGPLASVVPGLGQFGSSILGLLGSIGSPTAGLFSEGGYATSPVSVGKLPAFAEGTANTGSYGRGGIPSVLHPNEAVIPLSRGRKIGVELNGGAQDREPTEFQKSRGAAGGAPIFNLNLSGIKTADDFKKSQRQIKNELAGAYSRAQRRA